MNSESNDRNKRRRGPDVMGSILTVLTFVIVYGGLFAIRRSPLIVAVYHILPMVFAVHWLVLTGIIVRYFFGLTDGSLGCGRSALYAFILIFVMYNVALIIETFLSKQSPKGYIGP